MDSLELDTSKPITKGDLANAIATSAFLSKYIAGIFNVKPEKSCVRVIDEKGQISNIRTTLIGLVILVKCDLKRFNKSLLNHDKYVQCSLVKKANIKVCFEFDFKGWDVPISENIYEDAREILELAKIGKLTINPNAKFPINLLTVYPDGKFCENHLDHPSWNPSNLLSMVEISNPTSKPRFVSSTVDNASKYPQLEPAKMKFTIELIEKMVRENKLEDFLSTADSYVQDIKPGTQIEKAISHIIRSCLLDRLRALNKIIRETKAANFSDNFGENWEKTLISYTSKIFKRVGDEFVGKIEIPEFTLVEKDGVELLDLKDRKLCWVKIYEKNEKDAKFVMFKDLSFSISHLAEIFKIDFKKLKDLIADFIENFYKLGEIWRSENKDLEKINPKAFNSIIEFVLKENKEIRSLPNFYEELKKCYEASITAFNELESIYSPYEILNRYINGTTENFDLDLKRYHDSYASIVERSTLDRASISKSPDEALEDPEIKEFFTMISKITFENIPYFGDENGRSIDDWDSVEKINEYLRIFTEFLKEKIDKE